jgi:hypothetical protein
MTERYGVLVQPRVKPELRDNFKKVAHRNGYSISTASAEAYEAWITKVTNAEIDAALEVARRYKEGELAKA